MKRSATFFRGYFSSCYLHTLRGSLERYTLCLATELMKFSQLRMERPRQAWVLSLQLCHIYFPLKKGQHMIGRA